MPGHRSSSVATSSDRRRDVARIIELAKTTLGVRHAGVDETSSLTEALWMAEGGCEPVGLPAGRLRASSKVGFYAAAPITLPNGRASGAVWIADRTARPFNAAQARGLALLAEMAGQAVAPTASPSISARDRFAAMAEAAPVALCMTDRELRVLAASSAWLVHYTPDEAIGRRIGDLYPHTAAYQPMYQRCLDGEPYTAERVAMVDRNGKPFWGRAEIRPWRDDSGQVGGLVIVWIDITTLVEAVDEAKRSEAQRRMALDIGKLHMWHTDYKTGIMHGANGQETQGHLARLDAAMWDPVHPDQLEGAQAAWARHLETGEPYRQTLQLKYGDRPYRWFDSATEAVRSPTGEILGTIGVLRNIEQQKRAELELLRAKEEAEAANAAKTTFLATMSHEIRTPLNGVLGMVQAMDLDELSPAQRTRLRVVRQSGETLLALLNDALDLFKIEAGKLELEAADFDLGELLAGVEASFSVLAETKGIGFAFDVAPDATGVYRGDATRLRQILYNLVSNAVKFTTEGEVRVGVSRAGETLTFAVRDTGLGIPADRLGDLFQSFVQADASTTRKFGGTGLGLSICRRLAELMGGDITAQSVEGEGSTFTAALPIPRVADAVTSTAGPMDLGLGFDGAALRVLAADDNEINRLVLKTLLNQFGVEPVLVEDGAAAVAAWETGAWDVILMDVQMPVLDGPGASRQIRAREAETGRPHTPIVALTANAMQHQVAEYLAAGMDDCLTKPIQLAELLGLIQYIAAAQAGEAEVRAAS